MMKFNHFIFSALFFLFSHLSALFGLPVITSVSPHFGPIAGGTLVTIKGIGLQNVQEVNFGKTPAISFQVVDEETLEALAPTQAFGAVHVQVVTPEGVSRPVHAAYYTYQGTWSAYVPNFSSNTVTSINLSTGIPENHIEVGDQPNAVAIAPDGKTAYVTVSGLDSVVPIDLTTHQVGTPIHIKGSFPALLSVTPDGKKLYVVSQSSHRITAIDLATHQIQVYDYPGYYFPFSIATTPNGLMAYITNSGSNAVTPFDLTTHTNQENINKFSHPASIALTADGKRAYIVNAGSNSVTPLDLENHYIGPEIAVGTTNHTGIFADIAICPNGKKAYVTNPGSNSVTSIDLKEGQTHSEIAVGSCPDGIAITPDGKMAYVSNAGSNHVTPIDLVSETSQDPIPVGAVPSSLAITPDQAPVAYFSASLASSGSESAFDASASVSPVGTIANYIWDFGDGSSIINSQQPVVSHLYSLPGKYRVTLIVENSAGTSITPVFTGRTMSRNGGDSAKLSQLIEIAQATLPSKEESIPTDSTDKTPIIEPTIEPTSTLESEEIPALNSNEELSKLDKEPESLSIIIPKPITPAQRPVVSSLQPAPLSIPAPVSVPLVTPQSPPPSPSPEALLVPKASPIPFQSSDSKSSFRLEPTGIDQFLRPCAPSHIRGYHKKVSSHGKKYILHVMSWKAPKNGSKPVRYCIYRDRSLNQLAGEVSARKKLKFQARQKKGAVQTYYIVSVDKYGRKSPMACVVVPAMGKKR